jgi:uncharacterized protein (TIGR00369 family)
MSIPTVLDRFPVPPCAIMLELDILEADQACGRVRIAFTARPEFCNATGNVQGGFLSAMLDDCMGSAMLIATHAQSYPSTIDLNVQFLAPAKPGQLIGIGHVVSLGKTIGFVQGELLNLHEKMVARATASVKLTAFEKAVS